MEWCYWLAIAALIINVGSLIFHILTLIKLGKPKDFSVQRGEIKSAIAFSFTGAMSPATKESAFLHLPTYIAGIFYHLGIFVSIFIFFFFLAQIPVNEQILGFIVIFLVISIASGIGIFIKRLTVKRLRTLSNPDDYISNILVTLFQIFTVATLLDNGWQPAYYIVASLLLLYIPVGKLKHAVYFFAARYHLGYFYGWRGVWPPKKY